MEDLQRLAIVSIMIIDSLFLSQLNKIDSSWEKFLTPESIDLLIDIERNIKDNQKAYTPIPQKILRFLETSLPDTKVIILGQDPYPQKGVATGRAFEVGTLHSWEDKFSNISLKNIVRAIYHAYNKNYLKYSEIKQKLNSSFSIKPPDEIFASWENQGVLLLNTSFTCEIGKPNSHQKLWFPFTHQVLRHIATNYPHIIWFLWGNNAKGVVKGIPLKNKIESMHPMMCYNKPGREDDFLFGRVNAFNETKELINWLG